MCHFELPDGEAAFCLEVVHFRTQPESLFVLVGCASNLQLVPNHKPQGGCVYTFLVHKNGQGFDFIHGTPTDEPVYAIHAFKGVVLVGCGKKLRLYDMGKRRLLKKCENKVGLAFRLIPGILLHFYLLSGSYLPGKFVIFLNVL